MDCEETQGRVWNGVPEKRFDFELAKQNVLDMLDIAQEYSILGVEITDSSPNSKGWLTCRAYGREDRNPSAGINVGEGQWRGKYKEFNSDLPAVTLWDFASTVAGAFASWKDALLHYAAKTGVAFPSKIAPRLKDQFEFEELADVCANIYASKKKGIHPDALKFVGGKKAFWPTSLKSTDQQTLITFPCWGSDLMMSEPIGYHSVELGAASIMIWQGKDQPAKPTKSMQNGSPGLINNWAMAHWETAKVIWVCEGITDLLAMQSLLKKRTDHVAICMGGVGYAPTPKMLKLFKNRDVRVIFDSDPPSDKFPKGQGFAGATNWCSLLSKVTPLARNVTLPYDKITEKRDLRDWIAEGGTYDELLAHSETFTPTQPPEQSEKKNAKQSEEMVYAEIVDQIARKTLGTQWARDPGGNLYYYSNGVYRPGAEDLLLAMAKKIEQDKIIDIRWTTKNANSLIAWCKADASLLDEPPLNKLNLLNGILDLDTMVLSPHSPDLITTIQLPVHYDPNAKCPRIDQFISEVLPEDIRPLAYEIAGFLMTPNTDIQKAILALGSGGNGKSTYMTLLTNFLGGQNTCALSLQRLESNRFAVARLIGKLANICPDLPSKHLTETAVFKSVTGGDSYITAERKHVDSFEFHNFARLVFSANSAPRSSDASEGFYDRWLVVPFTGRFRGTEKEIKKQDLDAAMSTPAELSGFLNKSIAAYHDLRNRGWKFMETTTTRKSLAQFRRSTDPIFTWLEANCVADVSTALIPCQTLFSSYLAHCEQNRVTAPSKKQFGQAVKAKFPKVTRKQRKYEEAEQVHCYVGLRVRNMNRDWAAENEEREQLGLPKILGSYYSNPWDRADKFVSDDR